MSKALQLCRLSEIPDNGSKGYTAKTASGPVELFLVRNGTQVHGYLNRCPHTSVNLDWVPDQFLDISDQFIQCSTHGALFRIHDGYCIYGPCTGDSLTAVNLLIENEAVQLIL